MCGSCAMVINGKPGLACSVLVNPNKEKVLKIEPLSKFPVVEDLIVDRSIIFQYLKESEMYINQIDDYNEKEFAQKYSVAKCIKCGLCLEVCPNYKKGAKNFFGGMFANEAYLVNASCATTKDKSKQQYNKHFKKYCSKALSCQKICPANISTLSSIGFMNKK